MWLTLLAIISVVGLFFYPSLLPLNNLPTETAAFMFIGTSLILLILFFIYTQALQPLVRLEQKSIPNLMSLLNENFSLHAFRNGLFIIIFLGYFLSFIFTTNDSHRLWSFSGWWILFALGIDLLKMTWSGLINLLNPLHLVKEFEIVAKHAIQESQDDKLWRTLDSLSEMALNGVHDNKIALSTQAISTFAPIMHTFYNSSKSISRVTKDQEVETKTGQDEASYTLFYLLQRLELINDRALKNRLESVCRHMVMILGRIILYGAKLDMSLLTFPMHFLVKFGLKAQQHHFNEVGELTVSTILEIAKAVVNEVDLKYAELVPPFQAMIKGLETLAKGTFKQDKFTNMQALTQPLRDLLELMNNPKISEHRDTPAIRMEIERALAEFSTLEQVMRNLPPLTNINPLENTP